MKRSTERILTTHAGSLARPRDLLDMIRDREKGQDYDQKGLAERVRRSVAEVVVRQVDTGVDVVSDGEQGKPGFANYVGDRLSGLVYREGVPPRISNDVADFPDFQPMDNAALNTRRLVCVGPISWKDQTGLQDDIANFRAAVDEVQPVEAFMPAVSPGTLAQNVINEYYKDEEEFLTAVAEVMKEEYRPSSRPGSCCKLTRRTWPWAGTPSSRTRAWRSSGR
jgi:5-methyltetrahydropteroyltriglutamate--homocysteine methyltransferase